MTNSSYSQMAEALLGEQLKPAPLGLPPDNLDMPRYPGGLSTEDDQRLAVEVCHLLSGLTRRDWVEMNEEERMPWLRAAVESMSNSSSAPQTEDDWSEAKSPSEWQKELNISQSTWLRRIDDQKLVVDRITTKSVRVRLDTLRQFRASK